MHSRRDFLRYSALLASAAGASQLIPDAIQRAYAIDPEPGSTYLDAEHIVILMQENRSFDHMFGTLQGVRGFNDPRALKLANGNSVFVQTEAAGNSYAPWRLDIHDTKVTWMGSLPHSRHSQVDAWNEGHHNGWLEAKRSGEEEYKHLPLTMGYYTREDLPFYYALADAFTVCDQNYCSVMTSTSPNRCYLWTGTIRDEQSVDARVHVRNEQIDFGGLTWKTFPERLEEAGVSWKSYQNELSRSPLVDEHDAWLSNFTDSSLECFNAFNVEAHTGFASAAERWVEELSQESKRLDEKIASSSEPEQAQLRHRQELVKQQIDRLKAAIANSEDARYKQLSDREKSLHDRAFVTNRNDPDFHSLEPLAFEYESKLQSMQVPKGDILYQFRKDVAEGKLPTVSWLTAPERFSDHPSSPWYGAWYVSEILDILTSNPDVWKKTIFILTYDENDGYFDHAPSFVAADPKRPETGGASAGIDCGLEYVTADDERRMGVEEPEVRQGPIGMGFRVPMVVASPWSRGGWVNSQLCDHTSTLMFMENFLNHKFGKNVREENISSWRRTVSGDLTSVFRPFEAKNPQIEYLKRDPFVLSIEKARFKQAPSNFARLTAEQIEAINRAPQTEHAMPQQEQGTRPSCALPYELYADGKVSEEGTHFELCLSAGTQLHGAKSAGAPFNVYLRNLHGSNGRTMQAATFVVTAGDKLVQKFPLSQFADSRYEVEIHGPNGFYRSFQGRGTSRAIEVSASYETVGSTPNLVLHLKSVSSKPQEIAILDNAYKAKSMSKRIAGNGEERVAIPLHASFGWYDLTVKGRDASPLVRLAGRVETGKASVTDPHMGRQV